MCDLSQHFINTRPTTRGEFASWCDDLSLQGVQVWDIPLLALQAYDTPQDDVVGRLQAGAFDLLVFVSITAVECFAQRLDDTALSWLATQIKTGKLHIIAVGKATKKSLKNIGLIAHSPECETNEGMMAMPLVADILKKQNPSVLFCKGVGGRTAFWEFLQNGGAVVSAWALYERVVPSELCERLGQFHQAITAPCRVVVLISSEQAFLNWQQAWQSLNKSPPPCVYWCLGERLTRLVGQTGNPTKTLGTLDKVELAQAWTN